MNSLTLLVVTDLHYARRAEWDPEVERTFHDLTLEWLHRALRAASGSHRPDALVLLGDLVQDGRQPGSDHDLQDIADMAEDSGLPVIVTPGNHDAYAAQVFHVFGDTPGPHAINGYTLYSFYDEYDSEERCTRRQRDLDAFLSAPCDGPIVALQHPPIFPDVDCSEFPYMPTNVEAIRQAYERKGVILSLSGHYHAATDPAEHNGVLYRTCPAMIRPPFGFDLVSIENGEARITPMQLGMPDGWEIVDTHTHTHFGYCAEDVHPETSGARAQALGLAGINCVEHAGQVYLPANAFWGTEHINDPDAIECARNSPDNRMPAFRRAMQGFRSGYRRIGLELECNCEGRLTLLEEDREGWDVLLGAVHWLPKNRPSRTDREFKATFMWLVQSMVQGGIHVLAHPFRVFNANRMERPTDLYRPLAQLLKRCDVAAEMNFHHGHPDPEFFRICAEEGTRVVLSSDAHRLDEVGDLQPHFEMLRGLGLGPDVIG